ncbi:tetratricopeptide repeat protein [Streptomyces lancefieldiae]|uniref:Tetratricopeptide repeat protein n=1 Tax=Streptomyces lancefieldiae TaxID=3075520 RepID=A0ABU3B672_9ACTN|nr:tetratricopeptide repeat protein [Streptomyces sp. DSM 40712]MDT0616471.1 tetratricopeptide repeat protein [Streptomyces sp. DSM 40712]
MSGELDAAEREGRQVVIECRAVRSPRWTARSLELLGRTLQEAGHSDQARAAFEQSLQIYTDLNPHDADRVRRQLPSAS